MRFRKRDKSLGQKRGERRGSHRRTCSFDAEDIRTGHYGVNAVGLGANLRGCHATFVVPAAVHVGAILIPGQKSDELAELGSIDSDFFETGRIEMTVGSDHLTPCRLV